MTMLIDMRVQELLSARLCHELISPVGAIANGVELLGEDDPEFVREATALIGQSAKKASQRLQFYRFAYGSLSSSGTSTEATGGPDLRDLVGGLLEGGKISCEWHMGAMLLPAEWRKLICNMALLASEMLPRGGKLTIRLGSPDAPTVEIDAVGDSVNLTPEIKTALAMTTMPEELSSRTVHAYFTALVAKALGTDVTLVEGSQELRLRAG